MTQNQLFAGDVSHDMHLPEIMVPITFHTVVMTPYATWDFFPGHNDPDYARSQGQKTIYLNTITLQGFSDRVVTQWSGAATFIAKRRMTMMASVYAGDTLYAGGKVTGVEEDGVEIHLSVWLKTQAAPVCDVETTIILPQRQN